MSTRFVLAGAGAAPSRRSLPPRLALAASGLLLLALAWLLATTPFARALEPIATPGVTLLSADGEPIMRRGPVIEAPVTASELPLHVPLAFVAIEDRRFFRHSGIDPQGLLRAAIVNAAAGGVREGGSTITQQLAKLSALDSDRSFLRKAREMLLALWLEARLSKDEILSRYLSNAYFGDRVYGLRAAALHYFSREPEELAIEQAALLAGLVNAPSRLAPTRNPEGARARAALVIEAMVRHDYLDAERAAALPEPELEPGAIKDVPGGGYFADWALGQMEGEPADRLVVETTLDAGLQRLAEQAVARARLGAAEAALVAMRPDGRVVAMVGGKDYARSPYNRAAQARRQPGSAFKLFVYLAALREGYGPETLVDDVPIRLGDWEPGNADDEYRGRITLREAFARSSNSAAVQLSESVGRDRVALAARDLGLSGEIDVGPAMALGTSTHSLLEMTAAYAAIAAGRYPVRPRGLADPDSRWAAWFAERREQIDARREWPMMLDLLWAAANAGTGRAAALGVPTFGKTGTTQGNRDALFIGFAEDLVVGVWIGNDDNSPLRGISGGGLPALVWRDFMSRAVGASSAAAPAPAPAAQTAPAARPERARAARAERRGRGKGKGKGRRGRRG